jgi:tetratricopeptide (TPR) repeat protein
MERSSADLFHPRRSLGNRHRTQAIKFLDLANADPDRRDQNLSWAEQNARQSVLHDFTNELNWTVLADVKRNGGDASGLRAVLEDLFCVLGRDPELLSQLEDIDMLESGCELLNGALDADPLDADAWWECNGGNDELEEFEQRMFRLDLSDPRANVIFGRRLERVRAGGDEERFIRLVRRLLAHRPVNHEAWGELGRLHERRDEYDEAWFCYDQAQAHFPQVALRDRFRERMTQAMDRAGQLWSAPDQDAREQFLTKMQTLALKVSPPEILPVTEDDAEEDTVGDDEQELTRLLDTGEAAAAFFLARRLVTRGESWASEWLERASAQLQDDSD